VIEAAGRSRVRRVSIVIVEILGDIKVAKKLVINIVTFVHERYGHISRHAWGKHAHHTSHKRVRAKEAGIGDGVRGVVSGCRSCISGS